jgi:GDPmannose 4,6-dehydratase
VPRVALVTGIAGQDGYYLSGLLRSKSYEIAGIELPGKTVSPGLCTRLYQADLGTESDLGGLLDEVRPDEIYNLAGLSRVSDSFDQPVAFAQANGVGAVRLLEAVRRHRDRTGREVHFYQASSSEMFGSTSSGLRDESGPFHPCSPYACSKVFAHLQTINYREAFGLFASCGILFNHESPRRPEHFVTRKITSAAARIKLGREKCLRLGNIDVRRDWGFAGDYVEAMWLMLQQDRPGDYVIATGETHSVREFGEAVFSHLGLDWEAHAVSDAGLFRPADIDSVSGDASKARRELGWQPRVTFRELVQMMAEHDLERLRHEYEQEQQQQQ